MIFKKPNFWDLKNLNFVSIILLPFTIPIWINNILLNKSSKIKSDKIFSICVGNIYLGGTGKTPTTLKIFQILSKLKKKTIIAKKFYKSHTDEIDILRNKSKFLTNKSRLKILHETIKKKYSVVVFDDGLQDKTIDYDLKIVCFDTLSWLGNGQLIPAGPLREKLDSLIKFDAVILKNTVIKKNNIISQIKKINPKIKIFNSRYIVKNSKKYNLKKKYISFSGIGNPNNFKLFLKQNKFKIVKNISFPDHYEYKKSDLVKITNLAREKNAKIVTTEKDYVKIPKKYKKKIVCLNIDIRFNNLREFKKFLIFKINEKN